MSLVGPHGHLTNSKCKVNGVLFHSLTLFFTSFRPADGARKPGSVLYQQGCTLHVAYCCSSSSTLCEPWTRWTRMEEWITVLTGIFLRSKRKKHSQKGEKMRISGKTTFPGWRSCLRFVGSGVLFIFRLGLSCRKCMYICADWDERAMEHSFVPLQVNYQRSEVHESSKVHQIALAFPMATEHTLQSRKWCTRLTTPSRCPWVLSSRERFCWMSMGSA